MYEQQFQAAAGISTALTQDIRLFVPIDAAMRALGIDVLLAQAIFIKQLGEESQGFTRALESLNYSPEGLLSTFDKFFTPVPAQSYKRTDSYPADLKGAANLVYTYRLGHRGPYADWKYRSRRLIRRTGRNHYFVCCVAQCLHQLRSPKVLEQDDAGWFEQAKGCENVFGDT